MASTIEPGSAFVDTDEQREDPVPNRYVHGWFGATHTFFSSYFPRWRSTGDASSRTSRAARAVTRTSSSVQLRVVATE